MKRGVALLMVLMLTGCEGEKPAFIEPVEAQTKQTVHTGLVFRVAVEDEGGRGTVKVVLENEGEEPVPIQTEKGGLLEVVIRDENRNVVFREEVKPDGREQISEKEFAEYLVPYEVPGAGRHEVSVRLLLENGEAGEYHLPHREVHQRFVVPKREAVEKTLYIPTSPVRYVYKTAERKKPLREEEYLFMETGFAQSRVLNEEIAVYTSNEQGLWKKTEKDPIGDIAHIPQVKEGRKGVLVLKASPRKGDVWSSGNASFSILSTNERVKTPYQVFTEVIRVKRVEGKKTWIESYDKTFGLVKRERVMSRKKIKPLLELYKVEELGETKTRTLKTDDIH